LNKSRIISLFQSYKIGVFRTAQNSGILNSDILKNIQEDILCFKQSF